jgi:hypothetical protein
MTAATSKIRYANKTLEEKHQQQVRNDQQGTAARPRVEKQAPPADGGRESGNEHATQAEQATTESGLADDVEGAGGR